MAKTYYNLGEIAFQTIPANPKFQNLSGRQYGRLTVIGFAGKKVQDATWFCKCSCDSIVQVLGTHLKKGVSQSCGCLRREVTSQRMQTHGATSHNTMSAEYRTYQSAKQRCSNPKNKKYADYGGRGIEFRFTSFEEFFAEVGKRPSLHHSIERINNNGHYVTGNIRWATPVEQSNNTRKNVFYTYNGERKTLKQWAKDAPIGYIGFTYRLSRLKWCFHCALTIPRQKGKYKKTCIHQ